MKHFLPIATIAIILSFVSCKNHSTNEERWTGGPAIEVRFTNNALSANSKADPDKKPSENFEKSISSLVFLAYKENAALTDVPKIKYVFSPDECAKMRAIIPLGNIAKPGEKLDMYIVANCNDTYPELGSIDANVPTIKSLTEYLETDRNMYNNNDLATLITGVNNKQGFAMAAFISQTTEASGAGTPTLVDVKLDRTVARIDVKANVTAQFFDNYRPDVDEESEGRLEIISASLKFQARQGSVIPPATIENMADSKANAASGKDSLNQTIKTPVIAATPSTTDFRYYPFSCGPRNDAAIDFGTGGKPYDPTAHKHLLLTIHAQFHYSTDPNNIKEIYYKIPLTGTDKLGGFLRNNYYEVTVNIDGVTEQEIKATITVADWLSANTQNVNIGG